MYSALLPFAHIRNKDEKIYTVIRKKREDKLLCWIAEILNIKRITKIIKISWYIL